MTSHLAVETVDVRCAKCPSEVSLITPVVPGIHELKCVECGHLELAAIDDPREAAKPLCDLAVPGGYCGEPEGHDTPCVPSGGGR